MEDVDGSGGGKSGAAADQRSELEPEEEEFLPTATTALEGARRLSLEAGDATESPKRRGAYGILKCTFTWVH